MTRKDIQIIILFLLVLSSFIVFPANAQSSNPLVGKHITYNFNFSFRFFNGTGTTADGTINYQVNSYDPNSQEYSVNTTTTLLHSNGQSGSKIQSTTTNSSIPFSLEDFLFPLVDSVLIGTKSTEIQPAASRTVNIGTGSYQTADYNYVITNNEVLDNQTIGNGATIVPLLTTKFVGESRFLADSGIPYSLDTTLNDAYLTVNTDDSTRQAILSNYGGYVQSMKQTNMTVSLTMADTDIDLGSIGPILVPLLPAATPEFGPVASLVLAISILSIIIFSVKTRFTF